MSAFQAVRRRFNPCHPLQILEVCMSKGSKQRPSAVADDVVADNWAMIFNKPVEVVEEEDEEDVIPEALIQLFQNNRAS